MASSWSFSGKKVPTCCCHKSIRNSSSHLITFQRLKIKLLGKKRFWNWMSFQLVDFILNGPAVPRMEKWHRGRRSHILRASSFLLESINTLFKAALYTYCEGKCRTRNTLGCTVQNMKDVLMTRSYVISLMLPLRLLPSLFLTKPQTHSGWYDRRWYGDDGAHNVPQTPCMEKIFDWVYFQKVWEYKLTIALIKI